MAAVAHVAAEPTGVSFLPQPEQQVFYDEAAGCIHLVEGRMITAVALPGGGRGGAGPGATARPPSPDRAAAAAASGYDSDSSAASSTARVFLVSEGPPVRLIRSSLDGGFTALHRAARLVEVHCHLTGCMFVETAGAAKAGRKAGDVQLLGFFWTATHLIMVTASGLELHSVHPSLQALRLDSVVPLQGVQWYVYSPQAQMVVLGFGSGGAKLQAVQFSRAGTLRLPLLDLTPPWGSPIRPAVAAAVSAALDGFSAAREQPARFVGPDTCWVVALYGRVFCAHHDRRAAVLRLYRMFRDATSLVHVFEVFSQRLELSVVDNVLLIHHLDSAVVMLIDILAAGTAPISSPLPLVVPVAAHVEEEGLHGLPQCAAASGGSPAASWAHEASSPAASWAHEASSPAASDDAAQQAAQLPASTGSGQASASDEAPAAWAGPGGAPAPAAYSLLHPCWLVDGSVGGVYRLQLDLAAIADAAQADHCRLLAFLQRRRPAAAPACDVAGIMLRVLRGLVQDATPLQQLRRAFDVVNEHSHGSARRQQQQAGGSAASSAASSGRASPLPLGAGTALEGRPLSPNPAPAGPQQPRPVVGPQDVCNSVFALLRSQARVRPGYLQAALAEFVASCAAHGLAVPPSLAALYVDLLLDQGLPHLVAPLLLAYPLLDSVLLAEHVEEAADAGRLPGGELLAEQLLLRLGAHEARCRLLLRLGRPRQALALAKQQRLLGRLALDALLEAAAAGGDAVLFAAARRVCAALPQQQGAAPQGLAQAADACCWRFPPAQLAALRAAG